MAIATSARSPYSVGMEYQHLGRLERVNLRDAWPGEASQFTPWLCSSESMRLLGETLGLNLEVDCSEKPIGPFRADIVCKDADTNEIVLIENQLERTDHSHLGQILTYAAGLGAVTFVWIASRFREEHRAVLDWLNEITGESFRFFGLEVEVWRIGDSPFAPKFNIVAQPNEWTKAVLSGGGRVASASLGDAASKKSRFWNLVIERVRGERFATGAVSWPPTSCPARNSIFCSGARSFSATSRARRKRSTCNPRTAHPAAPAPPASPPSPADRPLRASRN